MRSRQMGAALVAAVGFLLMVGTAPASAAVPTIAPFSVQCSADFFIESPISFSPDVVFEELNWSISNLTGTSFPANATLTVNVTATDTATENGQQVTEGSGTVAQTVRTDATGGFVTNLSGGFGGAPEAPGTPNTMRAVVTVTNASGATLATQSGSGSCTST